MSKRSRGGSHYGIGDLAMKTYRLINRELESENKKLKTLLDDAIGKNEKIRKCVQCHEYIIRSWAIGCFGCFTNIACQCFTNIACQLCVKEMPPRQSLCCKRPICEICESHDPQTCHDCEKIGCHMCISQMWISKDTGTPHTMCERITVCDVCAKERYKSDSVTTMHIGANATIAE